jgi:hypothetical protein
MSNTQGILTNLGDESLDPTPVHEAFVVCLSGVCQMSDEALDQAPSQEAYAM